MDECCVSDNYRCRNVEQEWKSDQCKLLAIWFPGGREFLGGIEGCKVSELDLTQFLKPN